jgi:alpha-ribazole phosphatase
MDARIPVSHKPSGLLITNPCDFGNAQTRPKIFLVRHAESTGNQRRRLQGSRIGGSLSDLGRRQSDATAAYLFDTFEELQRSNVRLVSSPSSRALQTARPIADRLNCDVLVEVGLAELDFGEWSGTLVERLENDRAYQHWKGDPWSNAPPGGESLYDLQKRVCRTLSQLIISAAAGGESLVAVTHFFPLLVLFDVLLNGEQVRCDNASISRFEPSEVGWTPTHVNAVGHLSEVAPTAVRYV